MKVLWITNGLLPEATACLKGKKELTGTGGWILGLADSLREKGDVEIHIAGLTTLVNELTTVQGENIVYYAIPSHGDKKYEESYTEAYRTINNIVRPDVVHIHGTEYPHSLAALNTCDTEHTCVSIQGLVSVYSHYYHHGLSLREILTAATPSSIIRASILSGEKDFRKRSEYEIQVLRKAHHFIGRTSWDKAHIWAINPNAHYHYGGEILRAPFYDGSVWQYSTCDKHSIFLSQAMSPIKGLHMVLQAMPLVLKHFPDAKIKVAGSDIVRFNDPFLQRLRLKDWGVILRRLLIRYNLSEKVIFTGPLNAEKIKQSYLNSNVFVCPSSIENSPNSLGEAQVLGVPCVASYVGGIPDMMSGDEEHLYRFEDVEMLAEKICRIFSADGNLPQLEPMRCQALKRHDPKLVVNGILDIYKNIM